MFKGKHILARISDIEMPDYDRTFQAVDIARPNFEGRLPFKSHLS